MNKEQMITLQAHYKSQATFWYNRGDYDAALAYDDLASAIDAQILDIMILEQEFNIKQATIN